jgi:hypothetical protein
MKKSGHGEDDGGGQGLAVGGDRVHDHVLEDGAGAADQAREQHAQDAHRDDGGRDRGRDGQADLEAEVGVGGVEDDGEHEAEDDGLDGELRDLGVIRDVSGQSCVLMGAVRRLIIISYICEMSRSCRRACGSER